MILLVMQTTDAAMRLRPKRRLLGRGIRLQTEQDPESPNPTYIPAADRVADWFAERTGGIAQQSALNEAIFNIPTTAHILGGAVIGDDPEHGVVDAAQPRLRLREPDGLRRRGDPRQPGRQPEPDDHRARRARDGAGAEPKGRTPGEPPRLPEARADPAERGCRS